MEAHALVDRVRATVERHRMLFPGSAVLVAVSGGPDSVALLGMLAALRDQWALELVVAHADHGLRGGEGDEERALVEGLGRRFSVEVVTARLGLESGANLEARARAARERFLVATAEARGIERIATGHTLDDQAETLLLRLLRGAGRGGLAGIRPVRGRFVRPLLEVSRADARRYLALAGLPFAVDRSNADLAFSRNRVRRLLLPLLEAEFNPRLRPALAALAARLGAEDALMEELVVARLPALVAGEALSVEALAREPEALRARLVRRWLAAVRPGGRPLTALHLERILALLERRGGGAVAVPGPGRVVREYGWLRYRAGRADAAPGFRLAVAPGETVTSPTGEWRLEVSTPRPWRGGQVPEDPDLALFDASALPHPLVVRNPLPGDRLALVGGGRRKLQDLLVDAKVPRAERHALPVLAARGQEVLWVPGLARAAVARVGPATTQVVEARIVRGGRGAMPGR